MRHDRRIECSRAKRQECGFIHAFNQQLGDLVPARICLQVFQPWMFLRETLIWDQVIARDLVIW